MFIIKGICSLFFLKDIFFIFQRQAQYFKSNVLLHYTEWFECKHIDRFINNHVPTQQRSFILKITFYVYKLN